MRAKERDQEEYGGLFLRRAMPFGRRQAQAEVHSIAHVSSHPDPARSQYLGLLQSLLARDGTSSQRNIWMVNVTTKIPHMAAGGAISTKVNPLRLCLKARRHPGTSSRQASRSRTLCRELQRPDARRILERDAVLRSPRRANQDRGMGRRLQRPTSALVAAIPHACGLRRHIHRNGRSAAQPRPAPPIARCSTRATWRTKPRGSNRRWMKVQWQVTATC